LAFGFCLFALTYAFVIVIPGGARDLQFIPFSLTPVILSEGAPAESKDQRTLVHQKLLQGILTDKLIIGGDRGENPL